MAQTGLHDIDKEASQDTTISDVATATTVATTNSTTTNGQINKHNNSLPVFCNERNMSLSALIHTNIIQSPYFKSLFELKTYHEVIDEIYNKVRHLEPWERGSRRPESGNRSVSVRGVAAGGIVSSAFCLLYKLFTLRLTRKQLHGLINHKDSPYIRGLGFLYIRYTLPPGDFWEWLEPYLEDPEEVDMKAGGGQVMSIGEMCMHLLTKLDWFTAHFPRIPVPIQKQIEKHLQDYDAEHHPEAKEHRQTSASKYDHEHKRGTEGRFEHGFRNSDHRRHRSPLEQTRYKDGRPGDRSGDGNRRHYQDKKNEHERDYDRQWRNSDVDRRHRHASYRNERRDVQHRHHRDDHYRHGSSSRGRYYEQSSRSSSHRSHRSRSRSPRSGRD